MPRAARRQRPTPAGAPEVDIHALLLARLQFAFTISFHIIFPAFSIGLSAYVATLLVLWKRTGHDHFHRLARFWTKIFAVSFAMGVVSGIPLSYQFGTNWARFSEVAGNVIGPLIGYEVLTAFFLEATFLGVMLFGWQRVSPWLHVTSAILVALGTAISGFWILAANSWMHTPAGYELRNGIAYPTNWFAVIFNPSFPYRFAHMMTAAYLTTSVVVLAAGARYLIRNEFQTEGRTMMRMGVGMLAILGPLQLLLGDQHGLNTLHYQPAKIAGIEAHWADNGPADLVLFALPDEKGERNRAEIAVPHLGSLILTHKWDGRFPGLKDFPRDQRPPVTSIFFAFRIMVAIGVSLIAIGLFGALLWWRNKLFTTRWYLHIVARAWWLGFVAILAGWLTTESGRQPYVAYGILRTDQALSPVGAATVATSLALFVLVYCVLFSIGIYYIHRLIWNGPKGEAVKPVALPEGLPSRPLSLADKPTREASGRPPHPAGHASKLTDQDAAASGSPTQQSGPPHGDEP
jgi:cytochrome bd ubiquinol oxidase subunit I